MLQFIQRLVGYGLLLYSSTHREVKLIEEYLGEPVRSVEEVIAWTLMKRIVSSYEQGGGRQADAVARECSVFDFALFGYPTQSGL